MQVSGRWIALLLAAAGMAADNRIAVIAHRGETRQHPENTLPAFQAAIDLGCDFIEVDVRTTSDGRLVAIHNSTVDARTNGAGAVRDFTFEQIRALDAGVKFHARFTGVRVPLFEEVLALARGRIGVYVDVKQAAAGALVDAIRRHGLERNVVIYGGLPLLREISAAAPEMKVMPESVSVPVVEEIIGSLRPRVIAFGASDFTDAIIAIARRAKADIYVDRLGSADNPVSWQDAIDRGATGIQTDRAAELLEHLRSRGYHK